MLPEHGEAAPVTAPGPLALIVRVTGCRSNWAVASTRSPVGRNPHVELLDPAHGPVVHAPKREPTAAVAVSVTCLPSKMVAVHTLPQLTPRPVTLPTPSPVLAMDTMVPTRKFGMTVTLPFRKKPQ